MTTTTRKRQTNKKNPTWVRETYILGDVLTGADYVSLRYFQHLGDGRHVVVLELSEDVMDHHVSRFATIEEARAEWRRYRDRYIAKGYTFSR